jgi:drug/metabolite transporter (DMT)-like permease
VRRSLVDKIFSPYLLLSLTSLIWAGNFVVGRALRHDISAVELNLWRWLIALAILLPLAHKQLGRHRAVLIEHWRLLFLLGLSGIAAFHTSVYLALRTTSAVNAVLFLSLSPVIIVAGSRLFYGDTIDRKQSAGIAISLLGAAVLIARGDPGRLTGLRFYAGDLWMVFATFMWSVYSLLLKRKPKALPQLSLLTGSVVCALLMLVVLFIITQQGKSSVVWSAEVAAGLLYVGILASVVAFLFWNRGVTEVGPNKAGVFLHLMPVFGALLSIIFLGEGIAVYHVTGAMLVFSGIALSTKLVR